jgi:hypothetical protein
MPVLRRRAVKYSVCLNCLNTLFSSWVVSNGLRLSSVGGIATTSWEGFISVIFFALLAEDLGAVGVARDTEGCAIVEDGGSHDKLRGEVEEAAVAEGCYEEAGVEVPQRAEAEVFHYVYGWHI